MSTEFDTFPTPAEVAESAGLTADDLTELARRMRTGLAAEAVAVVDEAASAAGAIPDVRFDDIASGSVDDDLRERIGRRGCVVVRGVFEREQAEEWEREIGEYLAVNRFRQRYEERYGEAATTGSGIIGIYWSRPQIAARQHHDMVTVRRFLNGFWHDGSAGGAGFDPDHDIGYPDRLRRRAPGATARGLGPHIDASSSRGWRLAENRAVFRHVLDGRPDRFDPWDVAGRTDASTAPGAPSSVFRTFQGWTALSETRPADGGLHVLPIPGAVALSLIEGLAADISRHTGASDASPPRAIAAAPLVPAFTPIPTVRPGDTVWWHGDLFHSVAPAANAERWSNVMYLGAAPVCPRNDVYRTTVLERFETGRSPVDFPAEDFEVEFDGRATIGDLDAVGRRQLGLDPIVRT